jgi:hypothetical protein
VRAGSGSGAPSSRASEPSGEEPVDIVIETDPAEDAPDEGVVDLAEADAGDALPAHARRNADGSVTLPLNFPVTLRFRKGSSGEVREEVFEELTMHRLTGADMRAIMAADRGHGVVVSIARSARMNEGKMSALFDKMDGVDANAAGQVVGFFLGSGRTTGR